MIRTQSRVRVRARVRLRKVKCLVRGECQFGGWNQVTTKKYPYTVPYPDYGPGTRGRGLLRYLIIVNKGCHLVDNMVFKPSQMQF